MWGAVLRYIKESGSVIREFVNACRYKRSAFPLETTARIFPQRRTHEGLSPRSKYGFMLWRSKHQPCEPRVRHKAVGLYRTNDLHVTLLFKLSDGWNYVSGLATSHNFSRLIGMNLKIFHVVNFRYEHVLQLVT
jgi:hypothetical protein